MQRIEDRKYSAYWWDDNYIIEIVEIGKGYFEAYIGHPDIGINVLMFGAKAESETRFIEIVEQNLSIYSDSYKEDLKAYDGI